ncbi:rab effector Noc2 isoform X1 [Phascolarctos cinereus]|uniref:Rab effector Noc2 n=1 Tax=Phascolarctos cinereus TaxID=38626 RepID=A0A6P5M294_PHACI|nr:rab effector Noc2 isoform X2 [Phascolarctos cinereus]
MADTIFGSGKDQWVCPNDRQLALRAKLQSGWSVHTYQTDKQRKSQSLNAAEVEAILEVIQRAEKLDILEQQRIGKLVERLENMRKNVMGNGLSQCFLCGEPLGLLGSASVFCQDCKKKVCTKCGIETSSSQKRTLWLCKICSEQREVWKRSGAWFYKALPKYILPLKIPGQASEPHFRLPPIEPPMSDPRSIGIGRSYTWARGKVVSSDSDSDSTLSSSSLEDTGDKSLKGGSSDLSRAAQGQALPPSHPSESGTSLGSEAGGVQSGPESGPGEPQGDGSDSDSHKAPSKRHTWMSPR